MFNKCQKCGGPLIGELVMTNHGMYHSKCLNKVLDGAHRLLAAVFTGDDPEPEPQHPPVPDPEPDVDFDNESMCAAGLHDCDANGDCFHCTYNMWRS